MNQRPSPSDLVVASHYLGQREVRARNYGAAREWLERSEQLVHKASLDAFYLVSVDSDAFGPRGPYRGWDQDPILWVVSLDDSKAAAALEATGRVFMSIAENGEIIEPWEITDECTPNYVSPVFRTNAGPLIYADCKGGLTPEMGRKMLDVLVDALIGARVAAIVATPTEWPEEAEHWRPDEAKRARDAVEAWKREARERGQAWFVCLSVTRRTRDGRRYYDYECRRPNGTWTRDRGEAERFDDPPSDLARELSVEMKRSVFAKCLPLTGDVGAMPPLELRQDD